MAIVLEANYSKKLGLPGYSSHSYGVTVRAELSDINQVPEESGRLYRLLQDSVDAEIRNPGWLPESGEEPSQNGRHGHNGSSGNGPWSCSPKQRDLIIKVVDENELDRQEVDNLAQERFGKGVKALNRLEASGLIDELLERFGTKPNGNGRGNSYRKVNYANGRSR